MNDLLSFDLNNKQWMSLWRNTEEKTIQKLISRKDSMLKKSMLR